MASERTPLRMASEIGISFLDRAYHMLFRRFVVSNNIRNYLAACYEEMYGNNLRYIVTVMEWTKWLYACNINCLEKSNWVLPFIRYEWHKIIVLKFRFLHREDRVYLVSNHILRDKYFIEYKIQQDTNKRKQQGYTLTWPIATRSLHV